MKKSIQHAVKDPRILPAIQKPRDSQLERWLQHLVGHWFCDKQAADPKWLHSAIGPDALA